MSSSQPRGVPIAVDLDGSLCLADTTRIMAARLATRRPWRAVAALRRLTLGRDQFKLYLWAHAPCRVERLRFRASLVAWLEEEARSGRPIHIVTGAPQELAERVAAAQPFPCLAHGTTAGHNMTGSRKADFLCDRFGPAGFDYVGNAWVDMAVWSRARTAIVCGRSRRLRAAVERTVRNVGPVFP